jgi:hypothetical protein
MTVGSVFDDLKPGSANVDLAHDEAVTEEAKTHLGVIEWNAPSSSLIPEVAKLLDVPLPTVLVRFWQKTDEVAAAIEKSRRSPDESIDVSLFDSTTEASFDPYIEVRLNGIAPGKKIPVKVALPLTFKAVVLTIKNGSIVDAAGGRCEIDGSITLGSVTVAKLRKPVTVPLVPGLLRDDPQSKDRDS